MDHAPTEIVRPELTLPAAEAEWFRASCDAADVIFEYGSGGSTVHAAGQPGKTIFSVENDPQWHQMMQGYFDEHPPETALHLIHVDIGPVKKWGRPSSDQGWRSYHLYPLAPWDHPEFVHPDLILIDGRFRKACLLAALFRCTKPVTVLFDDYTERSSYHEVERFVPVAETRGRMARFELEPHAVPADRLGEIITIFGQSF